MISLLVLLREHHEAIEASLDAEYGIDLLDYWRRDEHGRPLLSSRRLWVRIKHLSPRSALARQLGDDWGVTDLLVSDLIKILAGQHHPSDPRLRRKVARDESKLESAAKRARDRRQRLGIKGSVLRSDTAEQKHSGRVP